MQLQYAICKYAICYCNRHNVLAYSNHMNLLFHYFNPIQDWDGKKALLPVFPLELLQTSELAPETF